MTDRAKQDRRLTDDRGAMAIMMAIFVLMFAAFAAFVIDIGSLYEERRDLQNGADAAAVAIAWECAESNVCTSGGAQPMAEQYASANSNDLASRVLEADIDFDLSINEVTVIARTQDAGANIDGDTSTRDHFFARIWGDGGTEVQATASARWGTPGGLAALPITISVCEWNDLTGGGTSFGPPPQIIFFHDAGNAQGGGGPNGDPDDCIYGPGMDADGDGDNGYGGFGFLNPDSPCVTNITLDASGEFARAVGEPGAAHPGQLGCPSASALVGTTILIPIYGDILEGTDCGAPAGQTCYHITGFGAFHVVGLRFGGQWNAGDYTGCAANQDCLKGYFEEAVSLADGIDQINTGGGGNNFGVTVVELSG